MKNEKPFYYKDVQTCVDDVIAKVGNTIVLGIPLGLGKPNQLTNEFFRRAKQDSDIHLKILTALTLERPTWKEGLEQRFLEPFIERVFGDYCDLEYVLALRKGDLPPNSELMEFFNKPGGYLNIPHAQQNYISTNYTHAPRDIIGNGCNVLAQMVSKETSGNQTRYSLSCNPELSLDVAALLREEEKKGRKVAVIATVNQNLPFMYGDAVVAPEMFDAVIDHPDYYTTLFGTPKMSVTPADYMIGIHAGTLIKDGGTVQIGIGSLGDALVYGLQQRHDRNDLYRTLLTESKILEKFGNTIAAVGETGRFEEGLYGSTEMLVDGYIHLYRSGIIKRKVYDSIPVQRLLNEKKLRDDIGPDTLGILTDEGVIHPCLTVQDFDFLKKFGIIKDGWRYDEGYLVNEEMRIPADIRDEKSRKQIEHYCLGTRLKNGCVVHAGFFLGPQRFYDALKEMSEEERRQIYMTSVMRVNQLYGNEELRILQRKDARFINTALMATAIGAVTSDGLESGKVISGVGGQYNFVAMAHALPGARSVIMVKSTRSKGKEVHSNILWKYGHSTIPRHLRDIVVTEYGIADLRGKSDKEVIAAMINIADSRFQEELLRTAKESKKIPADYQIPDIFRENLPRSLEKILKPYREQGLFPAFPFGTDFTNEEIIIGKALRELKEKMASKKFTVPSFSEAKKLIAVPESAKPYLERLKLDKPSAPKEVMLQRMVVYALASGGHI